MQLNPKKFKELRVNFQRDLPELPQLTIDGTPLETVTSHKLLGFQIQLNHYFGAFVVVKVFVCNQSVLLFQINVHCLLLSVIANFDKGTVL